MMFSCSHFPILFVVQQTVYPVNLLRKDLINSVSSYCKMICLQPVLESICLYLINEVKSMTKFCLKSFLFETSCWHTCRNNITSVRFLNHDVLVWYLSSSVYNACDSHVARFLWRDKNRRILNWCKPMNN